MKVFPILKNKYNMNKFIPSALTMIRSQSFTTQPAFTEIYHSNIYQQPKINTKLQRTSSIKCNIFSFDTTDVQQEQHQMGVHAMDWLASKGIHPSDPADFYITLKSLQNKKLQQLRSKQNKQNIPSNCPELLTRRFKTQIALHI